MNDATAFTEWLLDPDGGGLLAKNIRTVIVDPDDFDASEPRPRKYQVDDKIGEINRLAREELEVSTARREQSRLYMFLAGHGIMPADGEGALLLAEASLEASGDNIELREYANWYLQSGIFHEVVMFADCCRTPAPRTNRGVPNLARSTDRSGGVRDLIGYAADQGQLARESDERRGFFTTALLEGLRGAAAAPPNRTAVTGDSLARYLRETVQARTFPHSQLVSMRGEWAERMVLATLPAPPPPPSVFIDLPPGLTQPVQLNGPGGFTDTVYPERGPRELYLWPGIYELTSPEIDAEPTQDSTVVDDTGLLKTTTAGGRFQPTPRAPAPDDSRTGQLLLSATTPGTQLTVYSASLLPIVAGVDVFEPELAPGCYEVVARSGSQQQSRLVASTGSAPSNCSSASAPAARPHRPRMPRPGSWTRSISRAPRSAPRPGRGPGW